MNILEDFISEPALAKAFNVSTRTTARYRAEEGLPYVEIGGRVYVRRADADAWIAKRIVKRNGKPQSEGRR